MSTAVSSRAELFPLLALVPLTPSTIWDFDNKSFIPTSLVNVVFLPGEYPFLSVHLFFNLLKTGKISNLRELCVN